MSRHPNYAGEITLWWGIFVIAAGGLGSAPSLAAAAVSPLFVSFLLTKVSGIPMLEAHAHKKWGKEAAYRAYVARTRPLLPLPRWGGGKNE